MRAGSVASAAVIALLAVALSAAAQLAVLPTGLVASIEPIEAPIPPDGTVARAAGEVVYEFPDIGSGSREATRITLRVDRGPAWASAAVTPTVIDVEAAPGFDGSGSRRVTAEFLVLVSVALDAPALRPDEIVVVADAAPNGVLQGASAKTELVVTAAWSAGLDVQAPRSPVPLPPGGRAEVPIRVSNLGNGRTFVEFSIAGWSHAVWATPPEPVVLEPSSGGPPSVPLVLRLDAEDAFRGGSVTLRAEPTYAFDRSLHGPAVDTVITLDPGRRPGGLIEAQADDVGEAPHDLAIVLGLIGALAGLVVGRRKASRLA